MPTRKLEQVYVSFEGREGVKFEVFPSAMDKIKNDVRLALVKGTLRNEHECALAGRALLAAAVEKAREDGTRLVTARHVKRGWVESLSLADRVCVPSYTCLMTSVVRRVDHLKSKSAVFRSLLADY
ncbi:MAG TPA: hypothetical protein VGX48_04340 [Pyrinomonadaceae bacterium]|jgi:hypothetical protein|nr:hypothetical protein [Pyrinomonadaceae bacterium]